jgi:hypothetical protein
LSGLNLLHKGVRISAAISALVFSGAAHADVYKCTDSDGSTIYAQTPCSTAPAMGLGTNASKAAPVDCSYANRFATWTARQMRAGASSSEVFDRYGGVGSLSKESIGVINYVYSFRSNDDVSVERISALALVKCSARSFGDPGCEALPFAFTETLGGCDADTPPPDSPVTADVSSAPDHASQPAIQSNVMRATDQSTTPRSPDQVLLCKKPFRDQIDTVDAKMRSGYTSEQGEIYRQELRALTQGLRKCE